MKMAKRKLIQQFILMEMMIREVKYIRETTLNRFFSKIETWPILQLDTPAWQACPRSKLSYLEDSNLATETKHMVKIILRCIKCSRILTSSIRIRFMSGLRLRLISRWDASNLDPSIESRFIQPTHKTTKATSRSNQTPLLTTSRFWDKAEMG